MYQTSQAMTELATSCTTHFVIFVIFPTLSTNEIKDNSFFARALYVNAQKKLDSLLFSRRQSCLTRCDSLLARRESFLGSVHLVRPRLCSKIMLVSHYASRYGAFDCSIVGGVSVCARIFLTCLLKQADTWITD